MEMTLRNGFYNMSSEELMEVDGGLQPVTIAFIGIVAIAAAPAIGVGMVAVSGVSAAIAVGTSMGALGGGIMAVASACH